MVAVMPVEAQVLKGGPYQPHKLQGIGPSFIPAIYDKTVVDDVFDVVVVVAVVVVERSVLVCVSACAASVVAFANGRSF